MAELPERDSVLLSTFNKWPFSDEFKIVEMQESGQIGKLQCRVCSRNIEEIKGEARRRNIKGAVLNGILNYADGIDYVHKGNVMRHIRAGGLHDWAKQMFPLNYDDSVTEIGYECSCGHELPVRMLPQKVYMNYVHPSSLLRQLSDLWRMDQLCDAVITVDKVIVAKAHKLMMYAVSPKLKAESMSSSQSPILDVSLPSGVSHGSVHAFLQYLYEGYLILNKDVAKDLVQISKFLQINCLLTCCSEFLKECGNDDNQVILADLVSQKFLSDYQHVRSTPFENRSAPIATKRPMGMDGRNTASKRKKLIVHNRPQSIESQDSDCFAMLADQSESQTAGFLRNSKHPPVDSNEQVSGEVASEKQSSVQSQNESDSVVDNDDLLDENGEELQAEEGITRFYVEDVQSGRNVFGTGDMNWSNNDNNSSDQVPNDRVNVKFEVQSSCQYEKNKEHIPTESEAQFGDQVLPHPNKASTSGYNIESSQTKNQSLKVEPNVSIKLEPDDSDEMAYAVSDEMSRQFVAGDSQFSSVWYPNQSQSDFDQSFNSETSSPQTPRNVWRAQNQTVRRTPVHIDHKPGGSTPTTPNTSNTQLDATRGSGSSEVQILDETERAALTPDEEARRRQLATHRERKRQLRLLESEEERQRRLEANRLYQRNKRASMRGEEKQRQLEANRLRMREKRATMKEEERQQQLEAHRIRMRRKRALLKTEYESQGHLSGTDQPAAFEREADNLGKEIFQNEADLLGTDRPVTFETEGENPQHVESRYWFFQPEGNIDENTD